jgi:hypothetical protein
MKYELLEKEISDLKIDNKSLREERKYHLKVIEDKENMNKEKEMKITRILTEKKDSLGNV